MKDTHTTIVVEKDNWIEIFTQHDQSGSAAIGMVPLENIPMLIEGLKKFISVKPPVSGSFCECNPKTSRYLDKKLNADRCMKCNKVIAK